MINLIHNYSYCNQRVYYFFFSSRRRHTRCYRDWSSDVCSSDLLVAVEGSIAYLRMGGGCQGCGMAAATMSQGIEVAILDSVPQITEVVDVTDHAEGTNPYYQA